AESIPWGLPQRTLALPCYRCCRCIAPKNGLFDVLSRFVQSCPSYEPSGHDRLYSLMPRIGSQMRKHGGGRDNGSAAFCTRLLVILVESRGNRDNGGRLWRSDPA